MTEEEKELERLRQQQFEEEMKAQDLAKNPPATQETLDEIDRAKKLQELEQANVLAEIEAMMGVGDKSKKAKNKVGGGSNKNSEARTPTLGGNSEGSIKKSQKEI